ncbi:DUF2614 family zinc ribbon-containing protein [Paenibacillus sp. YN15]|uniref:DUF2614 family zinc ribbon-containing protein n=1 Tax=Paenibacillus sp. YN15 TaxID=1742774 RepID=UPI000DCC54F6|nr:hypothetical protein DQG13_19730 [Paenibacillus sp. YN15]
MIVFGVIVGLGAFIIFAVVRQASRDIRSESVSCPVCGKQFRLMGGSSVCPKCKSRLTKTADGRYITH